MQKTHMTELFYAYISKAKHHRLLRQFLPFFSKHIQNEILKYRKWEDVQLALLGKILLRNGLNGLGLSFSEKDLAYNVNNKPYFKSGKIKFNISHSGEMVVCAISDLCDIGIDIEKISPIDIHSFNFQMLDSEWKRITDTNAPLVSFYEYWTQKEAVVKAHGKGLSISLKSFEIMALECEIQYSRFYLKEIKLDNKYKCYLAFKDRRPPDSIQCTKKEF